MVLWRGTLIVKTALCYLLIVPALADTCTWSSWSECSDCVITQQRYKKDLDIVPPEFAYPSGSNCVGEKNQKRYCRKECVRGINWWKEYNIEGKSKESNISWPRLRNIRGITEYMEFYCDRTSEKTWLELIQIPEFQFNVDSKFMTQSNWDALAQQYIIAVLNLGTGARAEHSQHMAVSESRDLLVHCEGRDEIETIKIKRLYDVLKAWNEGHSVTTACVTCVMESEQEPTLDDKISEQLQQDQLEKSSDVDPSNSPGDRATQVSRAAYDDKLQLKIPALANHGTFYISPTAAIIVVAAIIGVPMVILGAVIGLPLLLNFIVNFRSKSVNSPFPPDMDETPQPKKPRHGRLEKLSLDDDLDPITLSDNLPSANITSTSATFTTTTPSLRLETVDAQVTEDELDELVL